MTVRFDAAIAIAGAVLYLAGCAGGSTPSGGNASVPSVGGSGSSSGGTGSSLGPCDLYESGGTPCVAAHSTVRALYGAYRGALYQVRRASDGKAVDVGVLGAGGYADSAAQDAFCSGTTCSITILYDQSGRANHLTAAPVGGRATSPARESSATALALNVGGHRV